MSKPNNRIALIGWSIVAAIVLCFFATVSHAAEDPYADVGDLHTDAVMDVWGEVFSEEDQTLSMLMGYTCEYMTTATSTLFEKDDGTIIEVPNLLLDDYVECEKVNAQAQLDFLIEMGSEVKPYFVDDVRDLDPTDYRSAAERAFEAKAECVADVYLITVFLPDGNNNVVEELAIARVLDRQCTPILTE